MARIGESCCVTDTIRILRAAAVLKEGSPSGHSIRKFSNRVLVCSIIEERDNRMNEIDDIREERKGSPSTVELLSSLFEESKECTIRRVK